MFDVSRAALPDAEHVLALQKLAYRSEAILYNDWSLPPLMQTIDSLREEFVTAVVLKAVMDGRLVGSVRAKTVGDTCAIGRLVVDPHWQRRGIGSSLLEAIEQAFENVRTFELFTGSRSAGNIRLYQRHGYRVTRTQPLSPDVALVFLTKHAHQRA